MNKSTKHEVYELIVKCTFEFCSNQILKCDSSFMCRELNISRSLSSQYLNDFYKEGVFIKIQSRPVFFLDRHTIESAYRVKLTHMEYYDAEELLEELGKAAAAKHSFLKAVGYDTSLSECITQCQSAVKYPPNGLPILLYGEQGVRKSFLAGLIYQYALDEAIIEQDSQLVFFEDNRYQEDGSKGNDSEIIFGTYAGDREPRYMGGLIARSKNGILVIDNVEKLSSQCCRQLMEYIHSGEYEIRTKNQIKRFRSGTRLIFTSCTGSAEGKNRTFLDNIPVRCHIPSLANRPMEDKERLVINFLKEESARLKQDIYISNKAFLALVNNQYGKNIEELISCIKLSCANAYLKSDRRGSIKIYFYHLPVSIISSFSPDRGVEEDEYILDVNQYLPQVKSDRILAFFDFLLKAYQEYLRGGIDMELFLKRCKESMNAYYDYIVFEHKYYNARVRIYEKEILEVFENALDIYDVYLPANCAFVLARIIYSYMQMFSVIRNYELKHAEIISQIMILLKEIYPDGYQLAAEVLNLIQHSIEAGINNLNFVFLVLNIQFYNRSLDKYKYNCVVISHGYSTASSLADAANKLVGSHVIEGIDMPVTTSAEEVVQILKKYVKRNNIRKDLILLVDMGSLENIGQSLREEININIGMINNVSTRMAVSVAFEIKRKTEMQKILEQLSKETICEYKIFSKENRKKAILFTSEAGIDAVERMVLLFKNSLPKDIDMSIFAYDYLKLENNKEDDEIFRLYDVLFIVGTIRVNIRDVLFVPIEDMIAFKDIDGITSILNSYFTESEQEQFNRNLIKNFTLENVMNYLVILNADKLLGYMEEALDSLQELSGIALSNKQIVGLYIHISCLIEKLVMKNEEWSEIRNYELSSAQKRFQKLLRDSFSNIMEHYKVELPTREIVYIYEYIYNKK